MNAYLLLAALAFASGLLIGAEVLRRRLTRYRGAVGYDVQADYHFSYEPSRGSSIDLTIDSEGLLWPELSEGWESAFVELTVYSTLPGHILDPCLEMKSGATLLRHYTERGAAGRRFLDVTELLRTQPAKGTRVAMRGKHVRWKGGAACARLHVLRDAEPPPGPVLVLAPHPDDAEIAAFGLFSHRDAWVVTVTTGEGGPSLYKDFFDCESAASEEKGRVRTWDSLSIPRMGGVPSQQILNLGYSDGSLQSMLRAPARASTDYGTRPVDVSRLRVNPFDRDRVPMQATWGSLVADMKSLLINIRPAAVVLPHAILDPHPDHQCTSIALLEAMEAVRLSHGRLLFYTNHLPETELYPFGSNDGTMSIPPSSDGGVFLQSMLSVPVDRITRLRKQVALETHHDLRAPTQQARPVLLQVLKSSIRATYDHLVRVDMDYVRRAARPNELFFVADYSEAARLRQVFLRKATGA